jgi:hypothetical protein
LFFFYLQIEHLLRGYVPLSKSTLSVQAARFDKGITGSAMGTHGSVLGFGVKWASV